VGDGRGGDDGGGGDGGAVGVGDRDAAAVSAGEQRVVVVGGEGVLMRIDV